MKARSVVVLTGVAECVPFFCSSPGACTQLSNFVFYLTFQRLQGVAAGLRLERLRRGGGGEAAGRRNLEDLLTSSVSVLVRGL